MNTTTASPRRANIPTSLVWFRRDLRLADNAALTTACAGGANVVPVFVLDPSSEMGRPDGGAARWWLHHSLNELDASLRRSGSKLILRRGPSEQILLALAAETGASSIHWNRTYASPTGDERMSARLGSAGLRPVSHLGHLLFEPKQLTTGSGGYYKVFTPFWRACRLLAGPSLPLPVPERIISTNLPNSESLDDWHLLPHAPDWSGGLQQAWQPGEQAARRRLGAFRDRAPAIYASRRDRPDGESTSRLSPHLAFGELSVRQVWTSITSMPPSESRERFLSELGWREFAYYLSHYFDRLSEHNFRSEFDHFEWRDDEAAFDAWTAGRTGYPIVDAGMRQLWATGWMHNRVRMIVASFLTKHLLIDWRSGERWFWDTLVDADFASNPMNWQWTAGSGPDAAPYFRIFNPVLQAKRFDPDGDYVRHWIPELAAIPADRIYEPWQSGLPSGYPPPIVDLSDARRRALEAFSQLKTRHS